MIINDVDIGQFSARQWNVKIGHHELKNESQWVQGSLTPAFFRNFYGFKEIEVSILVKGNDREEILYYRGKILSLLMESATLTLDGFQHKFKVILNKSSVSEDSIRRFHLLSLSFIGYEYGERQRKTVEGKAQLCVYNEGTACTPVKLELMPTFGLPEITVNGVCKNQYTGEDESVIIKNLTTGKPVVFDGEAGLLTEEGLLKEAEFWSLPYLTPGINEIVLSSDKVNLSVEWKPRYA